MKPTMTTKIWVDIAMTAALLLLMPYELIGEAAHEWIGVFMLVLFLLHHALNVKWSKNLLHGRYTALRIAKTALAAAILLSMVGSMVSGIVLSDYAFAFLGIQEGQSWARTLHLLCSYWGFVLMSLHLGVHWGMMLGMAKKRFGALPPKGVWLLRAVAVLLAAYGVFAFVRRDIGSYLLLQTEFVFFDYEEPLVFFFLDYMAAMGLFVFLGHYLAALLRRCGQRKAAK